AISNTVALGLGQFHQEALGYNTFSTTATRTDDTAVLGLSLRFAETIFVGATAGKDYAAFEDPAAGAFNFRTYQDVYQYGIGLRQGGSVLIHLEAYLQDRREFNDPEALSGKEQSTVGLAEINFANVLLGYRQSETTRDNNLPTTDLTVYEFGVQPRQGLAITLRGEVNQDKYGTGGLYPHTTQTKSTYALAITYQY
ncbi:MAG TPA: hypothetical protein VL359_15615, partial [bacterium]|nr:hypothetical protein [bacterium]